MLPTNARLHYLYRNRSAETKNVYLHCSFSLKEIYYRNILAAQTHSLECIDVAKSSLIKVKMY